MASSIDWSALSKQPCRCGQDPHRVLESNAGAQWFYDATSGMSYGERVMFRADHEKVGG